MLAGDNLHRTFHTASGQALPVLRGLSLTAEAGRITVVRGMSGCGKTTLLHIMAGMDRPDEGTVRINDRDVSRWSSDALAEFRRHTLGIVYQDPALIARYCVWQNVSVSLIPDGCDQRTRRARSLAALERVGLAHKAEERPSHLSGGEQQRVAIARALVQGPRVLVADEPTSQVDPETTALILALFAELRGEGVALLVASHVPEVWKLADRCHVLSAGTLADDVNPGTA